MKNKELEKLTGFNFAWFYLSTQAENIMIDFENENHKYLVDLLIKQDEYIKEHGELINSKITNGRRHFHKRLGEKVSYSKYDGADCRLRLTKSPYLDSETKWSNFKLIQNLF